MESQISKASEKRLLGALEKVSALTNSGEHPNDAIIKIAAEEHIPMGHVQLMVNAVNTGKTNAQRLTSYDPGEKAAEFPLADAATVLHALYPDTVTTKAAAHLETFVADEYSQSPKWIREKQAQEKTARVVDWKLTDQKPVVERDPDYAIKKAYGAVQKLHQNCEAQRRELSSCRDEAVKLANSIREYFIHSGHIPFDEVAGNCEIMMGKAAGVVLKMTKPQKEAHARSSPSLVDLHSKPYSLIKRAIQLASEFTTRKEAYAAAVKTANDEARKLLRPFGVGPETGQSVMVDLYSPPQTKLAGLGSLLMGGLGLMRAGDIAKEVGKRVPGTRPSSELEQKDMMELMDPSHEREIRNIQSEALLNDLLSNDEVIRGYDPEEAIDAYNEVSQLTPYAANKKAIIRDLMRKRLAGGAASLDNFTITDALGQQDKLRNMSGPIESQMNALKDLGVMPGAKQESRPSGPK